MRDKSVIVIGAGVVGLATAYWLVRDGVQVTVVDRDPPGDKASFGNAAGIAVTEVVPASAPGLLWKAPGWLADPLGPLVVRPAHALHLMPWFWRFVRAGRKDEIERIGSALAALNRRVYDDLLPLLVEIGAADEIHRDGALTVYESTAGFERDKAEWAFKRKHGVEMQELTGAEARDLEPALGTIVANGVFTPQWSHIDDPKALVDRLRVWLQTQGVRIVVDNAESVRIDDGRPKVVVKQGAALTADYVVVAAGAWSGALANSLGSKVCLESERGYNTTIAAPQVKLTREIIFAERKFVATPLSIGLRIGGAAEFGGLNAKANYKRSEALTRLASLYLPNLNARDGVAWAGHRPTTPDSLPVLGASPQSDKVLYAFGHGHLGLTQAATSGRLIGDLVANRPSSLDLTPYAIGRFN